MADFQVGHHYELIDHDGHWLGGGICTAITAPDVHGTFTATLRRDDLYRRSNDVRTG